VGAARNDVDRIGDAQLSPILRVLEVAMTAVVVIIMIAVFAIGIAYQVSVSNAKKALG